MHLASSWGLSYGPYSHDTTCGSTKLCSRLCKYCSMCTWVTCRHVTLDSPVLSLQTCNENLCWNLLLVLSMLRRVITSSNTSPRFCEVAPSSKLCKISMARA